MVHLLSGQKTMSITISALWMGRNFSWDGHHRGWNDKSCECRIPRTNQKNKIWFKSSGNSFQSQTSVFVVRRSRYSCIEKDAFEAHNRTSITTAFFTVSRHRPFFWQLSFISSVDENREQWNGFMQQHGKNHPEKSQVFMAPIIIAHQMKPVFILHFCSYRGKQHQ